MGTQHSGQVAERTAPVQPRTALASINWHTVRAADRSCCCSAKPAYVAVLPPAEGRERATELLLCGHHYRASKDALTAAGAVVLDQHGIPVAVAEPAGSPGR